MGPLVLTDLPSDSHPHADARPDSPRPLTLDPNFGTLTWRLQPHPHSQPRPSPHPHSLPSPLQRGWGLVGRKFGVGNWAFQFGRPISHPKSRGLLRCPPIRLCSAYAMSHSLFLVSATFPTAKSATSKPTMHQPPPPPPVPSCCPSLLPRMNQFAVSKPNLSVVWMCFASVFSCLDLADRGGGGGVGGVHPSPRATPPGDHGAGSGGEVVFVFQ